MNYKNALQEKGLNVENLSKSLQGQITKLEADYLKIKKAESEELGEEELALIEDAKKELETVDKQIAEKVLKFSPEMQKRREENMSKAVATRMAKNQETPAAPKVVQLAPKPNNLVKEKLQSIKKEIEEQPLIVQKAVPQQKQQQQQQPKQQQPQQQQQDEQEFDRVEVVKKKRNGIWFAVVGISALALTWGAVNIFKNNK
jgi:hypothetical protein